MVQDDMGVDVVPGMAEAIERRRKALGLSPGAFARDAGLSAQGLAPVRKGYRRAYHDKVKHGVAAALRWPNDCVDRLMAGEDPATFDDAATGDDVTLRELRDEVAELRRLIEARLPPAPPPGTPGDAR